MAAYAALVSLSNIMEQIQNHPRLSTSFDKNQIESLGEKVDFLLDFVENCPRGGGRETECLEIEIVSTAHAAEDVIESHVVDQILAGSTTKFHRFLRDLQKRINDMMIKMTQVQEKMQIKDDKSCLQEIIQDMDSIKEKVVKVKEERRFKGQHPKNSKPAASSTVSLTAGKTTMVGFDGYLMQILDCLTGLQSDRQIIPITGMGGIGKTTLARNVYENPLIVQRFDVRAWVTVSQEHNVRELLLETLSCLRESTSKKEEKSDEELGEQLYKILSGRRYFVVLDDMWSIEAWYKIKFFFPENHNGSRIVVTTRQLDVANDFGPLGLDLKFLADDKSWDLFCGKAFAQEVCPPKLEKIGRNIVKKCKGLPLSIVVIGGLLRNSSGTQEYWENVEKDLSSILNSVEDNQCLNILFLSYSYLPAHLKPCFLYLGIFPEDHEIYVSRLIKLWIAEGFLKPKKDQSLKEIAKGCVKDLVDRNLVLVCKLGSNRKLKTCKIHDLLRDLCIKVAEKEKFFSIRRGRAHDASRYIDRERRIIIHESIANEYHPQVFHTLESTSLARSVISKNSCQLSLKCRLLRVLNEVYVDSMYIAFQQVNLRFLAYNSFDQTDWNGVYELPSSISLLWNLQTLIIKGKDAGYIVAPSQIWEMPQLRHLCIEVLILSGPPLSDEQADVVLQNLETLGTVLDLRCSEDVCKRIRYIKKLHIRFSDFSGKEGQIVSCYSLHNVGLLNELESLNYDFVEVPNRDDLLQSLTFPRSLKKLTLGNCKLHWDDLRMIGLLPHLEVLKLYPCSVVGTDWNPVEGEFLSLKFLGIYECYDMIHWKAESSHFPVLENLVLDGLCKLDEIPPSIGEIPTLESICVDNCSISVAISAMEILQEQDSLGNQSLHVRVQFWDAEKLEEFREKVEREGFTSPHLQIFGLTPFYP